ncbi:hypothetical protein GCM10023334_115150 [Nonomuraea thailandensis]
MRGADDAGFHKPADRPAEGLSEGEVHATRVWRQAQRAVAVTVQELGVRWEPVPGDEVPLLHATLTVAQMRTLAPAENGEGDFPGQPDGS